MRNGTWALLLTVSTTLVACGSDENQPTPDAIDDTSTDAGGDTGGTPVSLAARLVERAQEAAASSKAVGDPLVGYQLYCVTFTVPPTAASAASDATGQVALEIGDPGTAFGCFVLDAEGAGVATVVFRSGDGTGQTVTLTESAELGEIGVDVVNGIAQVDAPASMEVTTSETFECPLGNWETTIPRNDCTGTATSTFWIAQDDAGEYLLSFRIGPIAIPDVGCAERAEANVPVSRDGDVFSFTIPADPTCPTKLLTVTATPNAGCTELAMTSAYVNCASCDGGCECGGELTCALPATTATRD